VCLFACVRVHVCVCVSVCVCAHACVRVRLCSIMYKRANKVGSVVEKEAQ